MKIGIIGLGKMGSAIAHRLLRVGHTVYGYDPDTQAQHTLSSLGGHLVASVEELRTMHIFFG